MKPVVVLGVAALLATFVFTGLARAERAQKTNVSNTQSPKKTSSKKTATVPAKRPAAAAGKPAVVSGHGRAASQKAASAGASHSVSARKVVVVLKKVNGRWVRVPQAVRKPSGPSYQTHPDPERYLQIQQALAAQGYFKGTVDGQWGDDSVAALKQFQTDKKLPNDGKISALSLIGLGLGPHRDDASGAGTSATSSPASGPPVLVAPASTASGLSGPVANGAPGAPPAAEPQSQPNY